MKTTAKFKSRHQMVAVVADLISSTMAIADPEANMAASLAVKDREV